MNNITHTETTCFLGKAVTLSNGEIDITVTLDVGPRIISLRTCGGENIIFEDKGDAVKMDCSAYYGKGEFWHLYGGHRLWIAPEELKTYYPDNEKCDYEVTEKGIEIYKIWDKKYNLKLSIIIEFISKNEMKILNKISNFGEKIEGYLWGISAFRSGGKMVIPLPTENTGFLPNRNIVLWPYSDIKDKRVQYYNDKIVVESDKITKNPFKVGAQIFDAPVTYTFKQDNGDIYVFQKRMCIENDGDNYPDMYCNYEAYCTHLVQELEFLTPLKTIEKGKSAEYCEIWKLENFGNSDQA